MNIKRAFLVLIISALTAKEASAAQHTVGGSQGWVESADLNSWASGQTFKVGDQIGTFALSLLSQCKLSSNKKSSNQKRILILN